MLKAEAEYVFETSWEVCNKVGGIYAVVTSKAALMMSYYPNYFTIGPYFEDKARLSFQEQKDIPNFLKKPFQELKNLGLQCHFGKWIDADGEPFTILIEFGNLFSQKNDIKKKLYDLFQIDSLYAANDFDEPIVWSTAVGYLLEHIGNELKGKRIIAHFHEWLCGGGLLHLKSVNSSIRTVFTTHATMLGRAMAGGGRDLYSILDIIDPVREAYESRVQDKFFTERACAQKADIFTTVSEITGMEAEKILGRKPEVLVLNGLDIAKYPTIEETSIKHVTCRDKIREFLTWYFFPYHDFPLEHNLIFFLSGRNEFRNKGLDIFIAALGKVNETLKKENSIRTISVFFWVPLPATSIRTELLENKNYYNHIKNFVDWNAKEILRTITYDFVLGKDVSNEGIFTKKFLLEAKKNIIQFKRKGTPPLCTHYLENEDNQEIIRALRGNGLLNRKEDRVKIIVYPVYLTGNDGMINLPYNDAIAGTHFGLFPSYYEPWGYTPLECAALGVVSLTTDLSGFGRFIKPKLSPKNPGMYVLERFNKSYDDVVNSFAQILYGFTMLDHTERVQNKLSAKSLATLADWNFLIENYIKAHNLALRK
ncbi:hypothetical protein C4573_03875 [Candidatus Woesearchaeota archaeon]|nr:MAG: hypothetical protein C4573_03875 [Candidatus Woesearchaeota archaeon]